MATKVVRPIRPTDVPKFRREIAPPEVIEAFNELIVEGDGHVKQNDVVERILQKMNARIAGKGLPPFTRNEIFDRGWLNVEYIYRKAGWNVEYDKPAYNETYGAFFVFSRSSR